MPSVQDIPTDLLKREKAGEFVAWLVDLPLDTPTRVAIMRIWEAKTDHRLTTAQYQLIRAGTR